TAGEEALRVAERIRSNIEQVAFRENPEGRPQRLTGSVGKVSFPHDGHDDATLLSQAMAYLQQAVDQDGNQLRHSPRPPGSRRVPPPPSGKPVAAAAKTSSAGVVL